MVVKRNGVSEPFDRDKLIVGVRRACQGRDVSDDALKRLAQQVEETVRAQGSSQVPANQIGLAVLDPLRALDEVAYLASPRSTSPSKAPTTLSQRSVSCAAGTAKTSSAVLLTQYF